MEEWPSIGSGVYGQMNKPMANSMPDFDPYSMLLKKKSQTENPQEISVVEYSEEDVMELESFCRKHGILGFNFGRMNPKSALRMLKSKMGISIEDNVTSNKSKTLLKG